MAASQMSLVVLSLLAVISLTPMISAYPATIYEALVQFGLPAGVLPDSVTSYSYNPVDSSFVVELKKPCYIKFDYLVYFEKKITGKINLGELTEIKGLQAKVVWFWLNIDSIKVDVPATSNVYLTLGSISQTLDITQFQTIHPCTDNALVACDHASRKVISQLPITAEEVDKVILE